MRLENARRDKKSQSDPNYASGRALEEVDASLR